MTENGSKILTGFLATLICLVLIYRLFGGSSQVAHPTTQVEEILQEWNESASSDIADLFQKNPDLLPKYSNHTAQLLLTHDKPKEAKQYLASALERQTAFDLPYLEEWSKTTQSLISQKWERALKQSISLQDQLLSDQNPSDLSHMLFAMNLLRIAMLLEKLDPPKATETWTLWNAYAAGKMEHSPISSKAFEKVASLYDEKDFSLNKFLELKNIP